MPATRKPVTRKTTAKRPAARSAKTATRKSVAPAKTSKPAAPAAAPTLDAVLAELKKLGTPQTAKTYRRHGAVEPLFGVKFGDLKPLAKKIGRNHDLAERLWATGNFDAMNLACMLADPARINDAAADRWLKSAGNYCACGLLADVIGRSPAARSRIAAWTASPAEYTRACGYDTVAAVLKHHRDVGPLDKAFLSSLIDRIEREIHASPNRARHSMNGALIAIGGYIESLRPRALQAAARIGKVEVDHGDTCCVTPDAAAYIKKMAGRAK